MTSPEISCQMVKDKIDRDDDFLLLDCREQNEYDLVHIDGAVLLPMSEMQDRVSELNDHQAKEIIVYCHHGMRSMQVMMWLTQQGFNNVKSMFGGIDEWSCEIDPVKSRY